MWDGAASFGRENWRAEPFQTEPPGNANRRGPGVFDTAPHGPDGNHARRHGNARYAEIHPLRYTRQHSPATTADPQALGLARDADPCSGPGFDAGRRFVAVPTAPFVKVSRSPQIDGHSWRSSMKMLTLWACVEATSASQQGTASDASLAWKQAWQDLRPEPTPQGNTNFVQPAPICRLK